MNTTLWLTKQHSSIPRQSYKLGTSATVEAHLGYKSQAGAEVKQADGGGVDTVDANAATGRLNHAEEGRYEGALAAPCATGNAHLLPAWRRSEKHRSSEMRIEGGAAVRSAWMNRNGAHFTYCVTLQWTQDLSI